MSCTHYVGHDIQGGCTLHPGYTPQALRVLSWVVILGVRALASIDRVSSESTRVHEIAHTTKYDEAP